MSKRRDAVRATRLAPCMAGLVAAALAASVAGRVPSAAPADAGTPGTAPDVGDERRFMHGIGQADAGNGRTWVFFSSSGLPPGGEWDESRSLSATFAYLPFTDGNQRYAAGVTYAEKMINVPHFDLTATGEISASHNDRPDAPYYNPDRDLTVVAGLLAEHAIWRRYEDSLVQALTVNGGLYAEAHFAPNVIATVKYEHRWRFDPW